MIPAMDLDSGSDFQLFGDSGSCKNGIITPLDATQPRPLFIFLNRVNYSFFQVPASCCKSNLTECSSENPVAVSEIWTDDCFVVGLSFVQEHAVYLAGVALSISSLMVGNGN